MLRPKRPRAVAAVPSVGAVGVWPGPAIFPPPPPPPPPPPQGCGPPPPHRTRVSAICTSPRRQRPSIVLGEAYCQLLPHWRQKCYALLWAGLSLDLVTKWCKKNFTQAYKELAAVRWSRQLSMRGGQASVACSS